MLSKEPMGSVGFTGKDFGMSFGEFREGCRLDAKQLVRPEFNVRAEFR